VYRLIGEHLIDGKWYWAGPFGFGSIRMQRIKD